MIPIGLSLAKPLIIAAVVAGIAITGYVKGRKDIRALWDIERAAQQVAAAQAAARESERARKWQEALTVAGVRYVEQIQANGARARSELERLRDSHATSNRVRTATEPTGAGSGASEDRDRLLGLGQALAGLAEQATADRAALSACVAAWPR